MVRKLKYPPSSSIPIDSWTRECGFWAPVHLLYLIPDASRSTWPACAGACGSGGMKPAPPQSRAKAVAGATVVPEHTRAHTHARAHTCINIDMQAHAYIQVPAPGPPGAHGDWKYFLGEGKT